MLLLVPTALEIERLFPGLAERVERDGMTAWGDRRDGDGRPVLVSACGFGVVAAAARSAVLLARTEERRVALVGLAGTLRPELAPVGGVVVGTAVEGDGVGVGEGDGFLAPAELDGPMAGLLPPERLPLSGEPDPTVIDGGRGVVLGVVLGVCAASASREQVLRRQRRHPDCVVEDMESHGVATAALQAGASLSVLRAVSNVAGDRRHDAWRMNEAFDGLREALDAWLPELPEVA